MNVGRFGHIVRRAVSAHQMVVRSAFRDFEKAQHTDLPPSYHFFLPQSSSAQATIHPRTG